MGGCTYGAYELLMWLGMGNTVSVLISLVVAVVTYFVPMIAFKNVERP
jgi:hypothetical protein